MRGRYGFIRKQFHRDATNRGTSLPPAAADMQQSIEMAE